MYSSSNQPAIQRFDPKNQNLKLHRIHLKLKQTNSGNDQLLGVEKTEEHLKNTKRRSFPVQSIWIMRNGVCSSVIVAEYSVVGDGIHFWSVSHSHSHTQIYIYFHPLTTAKPG